MSIANVSARLSNGTINFSMDIENEVTQSELDKQAEDMIINDSKLYTIERTATGVKLEFDGVGEIHTELSNIRLSQTGFDLDSIDLTDSVIATRLESIALQDEVNQASMKYNLVGATLLNESSPPIIIKDKNQILKNQLKMRNGFQSDTTSPKKTFK